MGKLFCMMTDLVSDISSQDKWNEQVAKWKKEFIKYSNCSLNWLTLLHLERSKLYAILAFLSAIGVMKQQFSYWTWELIRNYGS